MGKDTRHRPARQTAGDTDWIERPGGYRLLHNGNRQQRAHLVPGEGKSLNEVNEGEKTLCGKVIDHWLACIWTPVARTYQPLCDRCRKQLEQAAA